MNNKVHEEESTLTRMYINHKVHEQEINEP